MKIEVKIPAVGESIASGVLSSWKHKTGDAVRAGDALLTLDTDKVSTDIAAPRDGVLEITVEEGREVQIGEVVGYIDTAASVPTPTPTPTPAPAAPVPPSPDTIQSPAVRRLLQEEGLPPSEIAGTGKGGRITKQDVLEHLKQKGAPQEPAPVAALPPPPTTEPLPSPAPAPVALSPDARTTRRRLTPLRKKIAEHLVHAQHTAAILTTFNECDMSAVLETRKRLQDSFQKQHGVKLGMMSFFLKAVVSALKAVPAVNARIEGEDLVQNHYYDIGVAVGTERGLVVPVVRDADKKSFADIEREMAEVAVRAREGKLTLDELRGGVFSITNGGIYGSLLSTPILNPPQSGILGMHAIKERPVAADGQVVIRPMMYLALSYDHRLVDGREAVTFLVHVKQAVEDPVRLLVG
jgi:2-oxoglutarate dehydrogenase E2 component (dihydrolipoamide succinyltransferase)